MDSMNSRALKDVQWNGSMKKVRKRTFISSPNTTHLEYLTAIFKNFDGSPEELFQRKNWEHWIDQESELRHFRGEHYVSNKEVFANTLMSLFVRDNLPYWDTLLQRYSPEDSKTLRRLRHQFEFNKLQGVLSVLEGGASFNQSNSENVEDATRPKKIKVKEIGVEDIVIENSTPPPTPKRWKNQDEDNSHEYLNKYSYETRHLTSVEISEQLDQLESDQDLELDTRLDLNDKENFPVSVEEIDTTYPKPPSAPPLTLSIFEAIRDVLAKPPKEKIVSGFSLNILQEDLQIFNKRTEWLIDRNIDFYLELIKERSKQPGYPSVYIFHSFFYTLLTGKQGGGCHAVEGTTCEDNIFEYDLVFFPINLSHHWRLVVVKFPEKSMRCYDSMASMGRTTQILKAIGNYLKQEYRRKFNKSPDSIESDEFEEETDFGSNGFFNWGDWEVEKVPKETIPQQNNAIDCGVFCLQYAEYLSRNESFDFDQTHVAYFRKRMLYETLTKRLLN